MNTGLLLLGHGSPDPRQSAALHRLADRVRALADGPVEIAFLEHNDPASGEAAMRLRLDGADSITLVPLLLAAGFHARRDVPDAAERAERDSGLPVAVAAALGPHHLIAEACRQRVWDEIGTGRLLVAHPGLAGTPSAELAEAVAKDLGVDAAHGVQDLRLRLDDATKDTVVVRLLLADGVLSDQVVDVCRAAGVDSVGALAETPAMAELVVLRAAQATVPGSSDAASAS